MIRIIFLLLLASGYSLAQCPDTLEYFKQKYVFDQKISLKKLKFFREYQKQCDKKKSKLCENLLASFKTEIQVENEIFQSQELIQKCINDESVGKKSSNDVFDKIGLYYYDETCSESHMAKQYCWKKNQVLDQCFYQKNKDFKNLWVKCKEDQNDTCKQVMQSYFQLLDYSKICELKEESFKDIKNCLGSDIVKYKIQFCRNGCRDIPKVDPCLWSRKNLDEKLGCKGFVTLRQFHLYCSKRCPNGTYWDKKELFCQKKIRK